jgi:aldehyde:ferredoxin oxidoreductase
MMECGNTLGLAFEAYQRGLITLNVDSFEKVFKKIVNFEGVGKILGLS